MVKLKELMAERVRPKGVCIPMHKHEYYEFVYFINGKGTTSFNNKQSPFYSNVAFLYAPETPHDEIYYETGASIVLRFYVTDENISLDNQIIQDDNLIIYGLLQNILEEYKTKQSHWQTVMNNTIFELLVYIIRQTVDKTKRIDNIGNVISHINGNFVSKLNIKELAETIGYSVEHFRYLFKKFTGFSPKEYILNKRLEKAVNML
ncbi:MAG: AraC family transcriptional regulator, partial [Clostridiales bacterium]|nr:AraC family transcriptional regulator [Clostridiales bacterium]